MRRISRSEEYNLRIMEERRDGSAALEFDIGRKPEATSDQNLLPGSGSAQKILESGGSVDQRTEASDLQEVENNVVNPDRVFPLDELPASQGANGDTSCPETPNSARGGPVPLDHPGAKAPPCEPETDSQPPDPKSRQENIYDSVLHQMLQQQKHKHGRRCKKKTLMKMARLLVTARGWDRRENQSLSLQEELDLKEEISGSIQGKKVPGNPDTSRNLPGEIRSESNKEETKIPPERRKKKATEAPKAAGEKTEETAGGSGSDFTVKNKEEKPKTEKDPELKFRKKAGRKRFGEPECLSVSPGGKQKRKMDPVAQIQITPTASEADRGLSGFSGNTAAQETEPQESKRKPRKSRNPFAEQLPTRGDPPPEENRTKPEEETSSLDVFPKLQLGKGGAKTNKMSVRDQRLSTEMANMQNETRKKRIRTVPAEEETMDWDERRGTFSQNPGEDPIRSWKKSKGRGQRRKIQQQTLNFQSQIQPVWEAPAMPANPSMENQEFTNWDEPDEGWKIRRSCTLGTKTSSAADEWLIRYLKGSRRKASGKASNVPELMGKEELTSENGTKFKQTKRGRTKSTVPSANGETVPGNVKRKGKTAKQESAVELNKDSLGFPTLPASNSPSNQQEEERKRTARRKTGPKRRRVLNKDMKTGPKILESEVKHPNEGDPGNSEDGKPSSVRRARKKNVFTTKKEEQEMEKSQLMSSLQNKSNTTESGVTPETKGEMNMLQIEGTSRLKDDSLEPKSKMAPTKMKRGPKKRRILKKRSIIKPKILKTDEKHPDKVDLGTPGKTSIQDGSSETEATPETNTMSLLQTEGTAGLTNDSLEVRTVRRKTGTKKRQILKKNSISEPKIQESDEKHPDEGDPGSPEEGKPSSGVRRGRTKNILPIKTEDEISNISEILEVNEETEKEKSQWMTSELTEPNQMNLLRTEGMSDPKDDFLETKSKMAPRKMKREPKTRRMLRKRFTPGQKVLESDEKQPQEGNPGSPHDGKSSIQDESPLIDSRGKTGVNPNRMNLLQVEEKSDPKDDFLETKSKMAPRKMKREPKTRRMLRKRFTPGQKVLESDEKQPQEGNPGSPHDGKSSIQDESPLIDSRGKTGVNPNRMNLLQVEEKSDPKDDFLETKSKMAPRKMKREPKTRRMLRKRFTPGQKVLESDEKQPQEGNPGSPHDGKSSIQDESPLIDSRGKTGVNPNRMNLLQVEEKSDPKDDFLETKSKAAPRKMKTRPKKRRTLRKRSVTGTKMLESDGKHSDEGNAKNGKPSNMNRRRKKSSLPVKMEDETSSLMGTEESGKEKSQMMSIFQDKSNTTESGNETRATPEIQGKVNLLQTEGTSDLNDDFQDMVPIKMRRGQRNRRMLEKRSVTEPNILGSDEKHPKEGAPGTPEDGKPSNQERKPSNQDGKPSNQDGKPSNQDGKPSNQERKPSNQERKPSNQDGKPSNQDGKPSNQERKPSNQDGKPSNQDGKPSNQERKPSNQDGKPSNQDGKPSNQDGKPSNQDGKPSNQERKPSNQERKPSNQDGKPSNQDGKPSNQERKPSNQDGKPSNQDGKPSNQERKPSNQDGKPSNQDGKPSHQDGNCLMGSGGQTTATPEPDRITLLQFEGTSGLRDDSLSVKSKMAPRKMKKGRKKRRIFRKRCTTRTKILDSDEKPEEDPGATEDGKLLIHDENSPEDSGCHTGATPEPDRIKGTSALKEDFLGVKTVRRKSGPKRKRVLKKNLRAELKILESEEKHPDPGSPEDGKPSRVRRGRRINDFTIKMEEEPTFIEMEANKELEMEKSQLMSSVQAKSNTTESGSETRATPEIQAKVNLHQIEGVPTDPKDDSGEVFSKVQGQIQSFQNDSARPKIQESDDHPYERNPGASEDGRKSKTSNMGHRRKTSVFTTKLEDGASCFMEMDANKEPEMEKLLQESASSTAPRKTMRKRRRRSRTHWSGHRKAKKPQVCSFWDVPAASSSCDQTFNIQKENQENQMTANAASGSEVSHHVQKNQKPQCSFCLRSFRHISALTLHKRLHTGWKPYGCSVCAKSFSTLPELKLHSKLHRGPPATHCPICEETFRDKTKLIRHLKVHLAEVEGLQTGPRRSRRSRSAPGQEETFRCSVCSREFTKKSAFENHRRIHDSKTFRNPRRIHGFHVSEASDAAVVTPVFFKCPICRQIHRHWCHYLLHLHSHATGRPHRCHVCRQEYSRAAGSRRHCSVCCRVSGEEAACRGSLENIWKETGESVSPRKILAIPEEERDFIPPPSSGGSSPSVIEDIDVDVSSLNFGLSKPTFSPEPPRLSLQSWCGHIGRKRRPHRQAFRCSRCELEFHFLGSYMDHLQEHLPTAQNVCLSCNAPQLEPRVRQPNSLKCSTCGKLFSTPRNLRKHKLLHKAAHSHICLPCGRCFPGHSALEAHLEAHRRRLRVPRPARVEEPFLFPYPCRKCSSRFSSTDLLEAHQVCHSFAGRKPESPPESILSFIPNPQTVAVSSPGPKRWLLASNRKDLFRYPHPDRLYVVPAASSETHAIISDTPAVVSDTPAVVSDTPAVVSDTPVTGLDLESGANPTSAELQLQLLVKSLIPEKRLTASDSSDSEDEPTVRRENCAICRQTFADVTTLHEHYRNHARGM